MKTFLFQGDSITDAGRSRQDHSSHSPFALGCGYAKILAGRFLQQNPGADYRFYNRGISGNRVVDLYARWRIDALNLEPDVVSILIGVNDTGAEFHQQNGVPVPKYEKVYRLLLEEMREQNPEIQFVLAEPFVLQCGHVTPEWEPEMKERQDVVASLAQEYHAVLVPYQKAFNQALERAPAEFWCADGVHPTAAGHTLMAETWWEAFHRSAPSP